MKLHVLVTALGISISTTIGAELRVGIIGCDTSHVTAFTEVMNNPKAPKHVPGAKVVAAYRGGSPDIPSSANRLDEYSSKLKDQYGVKFYDTIEELCRNVDAVCIESLDGRPKLEQIKPVLKAGKPVYLDKPMAASLRDVIEIFRLAKDAKVPVFSSSSLRFAANSQAVRNGSIGTVKYAETSSPCGLEPHHPDLFWYGVHGVESLFTVMGTGCESAQRGKSQDGKIEVTGTWAGGRTGIYREGKDYAGVAKGEKGEAPVGSFDGYEPLIVEIVKFFQTGVAPVKPEETIELFAFMEAADQSKKLDGKPVKIADMIKQAKTAR